MVQYPVNKARVYRTIQNRSIDGSTIALSDPSASKLLWDLRFTELSNTDVQNLQSFFDACCGPYHAFTFIDPTDNMFSTSVDLTAPNWAKDPGIQIRLNATDPTGGSNAFVVTNTSGAAQTISQTLAVPASYRYCVSVYANAAEAGVINLFRHGLTQQTNQPVQIGPNWTRTTSSGQLADTGTQFTAGVELAPGQQLTLFGFQLEAQIQPSLYRPTFSGGGVYPLSHWASNYLPIISEAPGLFSASVAIQTNI
jgi:hypothetical protein